MVLHGITLQGCNNFQLFSLGEITGNYWIPVTSIAAMSFTWIKFHHFIKNFKLVNFMSQSLNSINLLII